MRHTYRVLRQMYGDRMYYEGDTREMAAADAKPLVDAGLLVKIEAKAEPVPANKAEEPPQNKAEPAPAKKSRKRG